MSIAYEWESWTRYDGSSAIRTETLLPAYDERISYEFYRRRYRTFVRGLDPKRYWTDSLSVINDGRPWGSWSWRRRWCQWGTRDLAHIVLVDGEPAGLLIECVRHHEGEVMLQIGPPYKWALPQVVASRIRSNWARAAYLVSYPADEDVAAWLSVGFVRSHEYYPGRLHYDRAFAPTRVVSVEAAQGVMPSTLKPDGSGGMTLSFG